MLGWTALALLLAAAAAWWLRPGADLPLRRIDLADPLASSNGLALAPDGSRIAYFSGAHLYVRALDALAPRDLGAVHVTSGLPFWSPDGRTIGFSAGGAINTIPADGGPVRQVCRIPATGRALDFAWRQDDTIVVAVSRDSAYTVPATGGTPAVYLAIDPKTEIEFTSVSPLPDNRLIVTTRIREPPSFRTELVGAGPDRRRTTIVADPDVTFVKYDPHGVLLFRRRGPNNGIWAVPFDETRVDLARAVVIAPGGTYFQADATGAALVGLPPPAATTDLAWLSQTGEVSPVPGTSVEVGSAPVLSPDGSRAAFVVDTEGDRNLVVRDLKTGSDTRLTPAGQDARRSTRRRGSRPAMKSSSGPVRSRLGGSSSGAPTVLAVSGCSSAGCWARSHRIASISCFSWRKGAPRACGTRLSARPSACSSNRIRTSMRSISRPMGRRWRIRFPRRTAGSTPS